MIYSPPLAVGIIGTGGMGSRHAVNLHEHIGAARVAALYDFDPVRARQVGDHCGGPEIVTDPLAIIHDPQIDAVIIASPDATHADFVLECLRSKKPVLCEKPLASDAATAAKIIEAETALDLRLVSVGFMRRFDPAHLGVWQHAQNNTIGRPIIFKGVHRNASIPYGVSGATIITNSAGHDIDVARWLLGQEISDVYVRGVRSRADASPETMDALLLQLSLQNGCLATIEVFVSAEYGYEVSAELVGEYGVATSLSPEYTSLRANASRRTAVPPDWLERFQQAYVDQLSSWARSVRNGQTFSGASAWDGYMALLVSDACVESLNTGAPVAIQIPAKPKLYA